MKKKGAGKKRLMMVAFVAFASKGVLAEGKYFDGYSNTETETIQAIQAIETIEKQSGSYYSADELKSTHREIAYTKQAPALAMTTEFTLDKPLGAYLRFGLVSDKGVFPYFTTGITRWAGSDLEAALGHDHHVGASVSDSDVSYGIGADFNVAEDAKINVEYIDYIGGSELKTSGFSFGTSWTF